MSSVPFDPEAIIRSLCDELPVGVWVARAPGGEFVYSNREFANIVGMPGLKEPVVGAFAEPYHMFDREGRPYSESRMPFVRALEAKAVVMADDIVIRRDDGRLIPLRAFARPMFDATGEITHVVIAFFDITLEVEAQRAREMSEARLHRAQRMEAVGKLAGGIAHDFNNLLTAIRSIAGRLAAVEEQPERLVDLKTIDEVAERAAILTGALTSFAGRERSFSEAVSLHTMLQSLSQVLRRALDPSITVKLELGATRDEVAGDLSQLEQVLMNLAFNARDAMPSGGRLVLRTRDVMIGENPSPLERGRHVVLEVSDTGTGIDPSVREHMFEPYVSTKRTNGGLGLATVYGIVEAHKGTIEALDSPPRGTLIRVTLPLAPDGMWRRGAPPASEARLAAGSGTVLLVEDEALVRVSTFRALRQLGYQVIACADGDEAIEIFRDRRADIQAVMLDVAMPKLSGRQTFLALRGIDPSVRVLVVAGSSHNGEVDRILSLGAREFLPKPFELRALSQALERVISQPPP